MAITSIDAKLLQKMFLAGAKNLEAKKEWINELNVFPVPDGDTGTNMKMTMDGGANAIRNSHEESIGQIAKELARGMVFSARGNSGVILSQFFKGLSIGLEEYSTVTPKEFALAMVHGVNQAYKVVNNPTEGTILTVMREASQTAYESVCETFEEVLDVLKHHSFDLQKLETFIKDSFPQESGNASDRLINEVILRKEKKL